VIDSATYLASACLLGMMRGDYNVADTEKEYTSPWHQFKSMTVDGAQYLRSCFFGALVFVKFTGALIYGAADILNVVLSEQQQQQQPVPGEVTDPNQRLGLLFSVVGVGCLLGPLIAEPFMDMERPASLQLSCVVSFGIMAFGFYGWSMFTPFWSLCFFASIRAAGSSILWINSSILLQKFSEPQMLGRVMAVDVALAYSTEAASAYVCGVLLDKVGLTAPEVSFVFGSFGALCMLLWGWYHFSGGGATGYHQDELLTMQLNSTDYSLSKPLIVSTETSSLMPVR
jgi:MFS family permease